MKINEKNVVSFAVSNSPIDKEGYLLKKGEVNKGYQKRWFILKGNLLFYFERRTDKEPIGMIILEGCIVELEEQHLDTYTFCINFPGPGCRSYILACNSQEEMESWMKSITCASYDYMKLMVSELQKQLEEVNLHSTSTIKTREGVPTQDAPVPSTLEAPQRRFNPFNSGRSDPITVGNAVFHTPVDPVDTEELPSFDFDEMHRVYGMQIRRKLLEYSMTSVTVS